MVPAVPVPIIVNPTCSGVMRRPPEWRPPDPTDNTTNHQANRPGEQQARPGTENRADVIRARTRRSNGKGNQNWRCSQQSPAHSSSPVRLNVKSNTRAPDTQRSKRVGDFFPLDCCGTATRHTHAALAPRYPQNEMLWSARDFVSVEWPRPRRQVGWVEAQPEATALAAKGMSWATPGSRISGDKTPPLAPKLE
jgi:hypothetical protein